MFIATERTPNPATLKFLPGRQVMAAGATANFADAVAAEASPLAAALFSLPGVDGVFFGGDFVSVTAKDGAWDQLKPQVLGVIMEHFTAGAPLFTDAAAVQDTGAGLGDAPEDEAVIHQIKELLETKVRPAVAQDGGDIVYHGFKNGVVYLHMQGACSGCPSSTITLKNGIENLLRHYVPEVSAVQAI